jgi:hypothetical protein
MDKKAANFHHSLGIGQLLDPNLRLMKKMCRHPQAEIWTL